MKLHASGEDYLETILVLQKKRGMVRSVDVARHMEVSKPSVCHAVATLPVGKEAVLFVDLLRHFPAHIGQMEKVIFVHHKKAAVPQGSHCMAHAGL